MSDGSKRAPGIRVSAAAIVVAVAVVGAVAAIVVELWSAIGATEISPAGWLAMILGIVVTLALGIGLMTLVFISSRRGYDDPGRQDC
jgi:hypothetical protein